MILKWFKARADADIGVALADQFALQTRPDPATRTNKTPARDLDSVLRDLFERADREVRPLRLNFFKKAQFANSFKWRLIENDIQKEIADEVTQRLVLHLAGDWTDRGLDKALGAAPSTQSKAKAAKELLSQGNRCMENGAYAEALAFYQELVSLNPRHPAGLNNLGAALCKLGHYDEAVVRFRQAIRINPHDADAHGNLGNVLRWTGQIAEAEIWLRSALKLNPSCLDARNNLGLAFAFLGRLREAEAHFRKVLKVAPRNADALFGMGHIAKLQGHFDDAETSFRRALEVNPKMPSAWADLAGIRKQTKSDGAWLSAAEELAASGIAPLDEAEMRFAIGKYYDDVGDFRQAFRSYQRANELSKSIAEKYDPGKRTHFVDEMIRAYSRESAPQFENGASDSTKPIFVVGMPRSGTSLAEQIIASHPSVKGAGELTFWSDAGREHGAAVFQGQLEGSTKRKLAESYLSVLGSLFKDAKRVVDKAPVNSDYLGLIHSVFPNARVIYMQRDPIDTCLSCYFQKFVLSLNFTMDLSDLAHYYREHYRLMAHWRSVLPPGTILDVPYEALVANQEAWSRKIIGFLGLDWDEACMDFQNTQRPVVTASSWQVRQKIYKHSVERWRNYEKSISPLLALKRLDS
jgi:tetratricopeptide (TPR) repeat protein